MKAFFKVLMLLFTVIFIWNCQKKSDLKSKNVDRKVVEMTTNYGTMVLELYNETPLHRDNFIKLVKEKAYDSLLFHRVIHDFMIQAGDPDSKNSASGEALGNGDLDYKVPAEINSELFHKRGALGAARDGNPERASSSMQFYIVQRGIQNDSLINRGETRINGWLADHYSYKDPANKELVASFEKAIEAKDSLMVRSLYDSLRRIAKNYTNFKKYTIPDSHRKTYKTVGGTPHLDQNYTVFGELIKGFDVLDSIAKTETGKRDRPITDVRIKSVKLLSND